MDDLALDADFWQALDQLVASSEIVIDRPKNTAHPRYLDMIYPLDYGYLANTAAMDQGGVDVWIGSLADRQVVGIVATVDLFKRDTEIKILLGCTEEEITTIGAFLNQGSQRGKVIRRSYQRPCENKRIKVGMIDLPLDWSTQEGRDYIRGNFFYDTMYCLDPARAFIRLMMRPDLHKQYLEFTNIVERNLKAYKNLYSQFQTWLYLYWKMRANKKEQVSTADILTGNEVDRLAGVYGEINELVDKMQIELHRMTFSSDINDQIETLWHLSNESIEKLTDGFSWS